MKPSLLTSPPSIKRRHLRRKQQKRLHKCLKTTSMERLTTALAQMYLNRLYTVWQLIKPSMYCSSTNNLRRQSEKLALLGELVDAMPEPDIIRILYEVFVTRCQGPVGNFVHTPAYIEPAKKIYGCLDRSYHIAPMDTLACHLLVVRMSP